MLNNPIKFNGKNYSFLKYSCPGGEPSSLVGLLSTPLGATCFIMEKFDLFNQPPLISENNTWKDIKGYEGLYKVRADGAIFGIKRQTIVNSSINPDTGYRQVSLRKKSKATTCSLHRIVATAFVPNPDDKNVVNHLDRNRSNCRASNLEWCTYSENMLHYNKHKRGDESEKVDFVLLNIDTLSIRQLSKKCGFKDLYQFRRFCKRNDIDINKRKTKMLRTPVAFE